MRFCPSGRQSRRQQNDERAKGGKHNWNKWIKTKPKCLANDDGIHCYHLQTQKTPNGVESSTSALLEKIQRAVHSLKTKPRWRQTVSLQNVLITHSNFILLNGLCMLTDDAYFTYNKRSSNCTRNALQNMNAKFAIHHCLTSTLKIQTLSHTEDVG